MNIKRIVFASLFCIAVLLCVGKKAEAAFPYDMEQKPVTATSIQDGKVAVYSDENLKNKKEEVAGRNHEYQEWLQLCKEGYINRC